MKFKMSKTSLYVNTNLTSTHIPYVFLHGFTESSNQWNSILKNFKHPYVLIDIPGHGKSTFHNRDVDYDFSDFSSEIYLMLNELNIKHINLCGYSMGGRLATIFAAKYPHKINSLILESTGLGIKDYEEREKRKRRYLISGRIVRL